MSRFFYILLNLDSKLKMKLEEVNKINPNALLTSTGVIFDAFNPKLEDIKVEDIAHALSNLCRYGGHCPKFYSVAQHAVLCSYHDGSYEEQMEFLNHDDSEAFLVDMPRPIKRNMPEYSKIEDGLQAAISKALGLPYPFSERVHEVDEALLHYEYKNFFEEPNPDFVFWTPEYAKEQFIERYNFLRDAIDSKKSLARCQEKLALTLRDVQDFPKPGILFKDITPVLANASLCKQIVNEFVSNLKYHIGAVAGIESRGFFFGFLLANKLGVPFIPIRKPGKLPFTTISMEYELEYGTGKIEMNSDAINPGTNVLIHDDLLATGGTAAAAAKLIKSAGGNVAGFCFVIGLKELKGEDKLKPYSDNIFNLLQN